MDIVDRNSSGRYVTLSKLGPVGIKGIDGIQGDEYLYYQTSGTQILDTLNIDEFTSIKYDIQISSRGGYYLCQLRIIKYDTEIFLDEIRPVYNDTRLIENFTTSINDGVVTIYGDLLTSENHIRYMRSILSYTSTEISCDELWGDLMEGVCSTDLQTDTGGNVDLSL